MSKIQILKAIHNSAYSHHSTKQVVSDVKDTNFESNSQHKQIDAFLKLVVSDVKDTNFESNSQQNACGYALPTVVSDVKDTNFESNSQHFSFLI